MSIVSKISNLFNDFEGLFYPRLCVSCEENLYRHEELICTKCLYNIPYTNYHLIDDNPVSRLFWGRVEVLKATSFFHFDKGGKVQNLIHKFKYKGQKEIGLVLGQHFGEYLKDALGYSTVDLIVPVPLHADKVKIRGYNQSEWIAKGLSLSMEIPFNSTNLIRVKATETQTKKTRWERWENVRSVFKIVNPKLFANKHILLVDDVVTTGSTLEACANMILEIENTKISISALAKA